MNKRFWHKRVTRLAAFVVGVALLCACGAQPAAELSAELLQPTAQPTSGATVAVKDAPGRNTIPIVPTGSFELPVENATGYTLFAQPMYRNADKTSAVVYDAPSGMPFRVLQINADETWWKVVDATGTYTGWFPTEITMINLPDVVPSIIYNDANATASLFRASGFEIPGITDQKLYDSYKENPRFGAKQYVMPVLYNTAKKWYEVQQSALAAGYCVEIYQLFRPYRTQREVCNAVAELLQVNPIVNAGINTSPWGLSWFISTGTSNHQRGFACDATLVRILDSELASCSGYHYTRVTNYEDVVMPTVMHELSMAAASMAAPISPLKDTWRNVREAPTMNYYSRLLKKFATNAGLSPLASEWWHFNDLDARIDEVVEKARGDFVPNVCLSQPPSRAPTPPTPTPEPTEPVWPPIESVDPAPTPQPTTPQPTTPSQGDETPEEEPEL